MMYDKESKSRASEASMINTAYADTRKWDKLGMDFITEFPRTRLGYDSIWVVVDSLDQSGSLYPSENHLYKCEVGQDIFDQDVCLQGVPRTIDRGTRLPQSFGISCITLWVPG